MAFSKFKYLCRPLANKRQNNDSNYSVEGEIEAILEKRQKVEYEDSLSKYERGNLVLVEGRPGNGKTTLAHKMLQNVHMVLLISLCKDKQKKIRTKPINSH